MEYQEARSVEETTSWVWFLKTSHSRTNIPTRVLPKRVYIVLFLDCTCDSGITMTCFTMGSLLSERTTFYEKGNLLAMGFPHILICDPETTPNKKAVTIFFLRKWLRIYPEQ